MMHQMDWNDAQAIKKASECLKDGKVIVGTSDTIVGLLAPLIKEGSDALDQIKKRAKMPYLVLVSSIDKAKNFTDVFERQDIAKVAQSFWPGPLTLIVPAKESVPDFIKSKEGGIAIRIPDHQGLQNLLAQVDGLFSTSANVSGQPVPERLDDIDAELLQHVCAIVGEEKEPQIVPSTILDCMGDKIDVKREGAVSLQRLQRFID